MPMTSSDVDQLFKRTDREMLAEPDRDTEVAWANYFEQTGSKVRTRTYYSDEAMPAVNEKLEAVDAIELADGPGYTKKATKRTWGAAVPVTIEATEFDEFGKIARRLAKLPGAFQFQEEEMGAALYDWGALQNVNVPIRGDGGIPGVDVETPDGLPFLSQLHTFRTSPGRTYSNISPTPATANQDSIEAAMQKIRQYTDSQGALLQYKNNVKIVAPTALVESLKRIFGSELQSDTNQNATNVLRGIQVEEWRWLRNQNRFYIWTGYMPPIRDYGWQRRREPDDVNGRAGVRVYTQTMNYAQFPRDPRTVYAIGS
jgi:hypothetical protein